VPKPILRRVASRYIAGETLDEAIAKLRSLAAAGHPGIIDILGEDVTNEAQARAVIHDYENAASSVRANGLDAYVSVKPTHCGLRASEKLALELYLQLARRAFFAWQAASDQGAAWSTLDPADFPRCVALPAKQAGGGCRLRNFGLIGQKGFGRGRLGFALAFQALDPGSNLSNRRVRLFFCRRRRLRGCLHRRLIAANGAHEGHDLLACGRHHFRPSGIVQRSGGKQRRRDLQAVAGKDGDQSRLCRATGNTARGGSADRPSDRPHPGTHHGQCRVEQRRINFIMGPGKQVYQLAPADGPIVGVHNRLGHYCP